ncbi:MAG: hypothetical protein ACJART_001330 [Maribacter sp.]|jgi:hypothetical protein
MECSVQKRNYIFRINPELNCYILFDKLKSLPRFRDKKMAVFANKQKRLIKISIEMFYAHQQTFFLLVFIIQVF